MVWADSYKIGCGHITFTGGIGFNKLIVCNFGAAGNFVDDKVYERGEACSSCPDGTSCSKKYKALCGELDSNCE